MSHARRRVPFRQLLRRTACWSTLLAAGGCGGGGSSDIVTPPPVQTPVLTTLSVSVAPASVQAGLQSTASASGLDQNGAPIATGTVTWNSSAPSVATIASNGAISTLSAGQTQIIGTAGVKTGQATLTVTAAPVTTTVTVTLSNTSVVQGQTVTAQATPLDQNGALLQGRSVSWSTGSSAIATVSAAGVVTGVAPGPTTVIATIDGKTGQAALTVTAVPVATVTVAPPAPTIVVGATVQLTATTLDAGGNTLSGRTVSWTTSDQTKASVSSSGLATGVAAGTATITATSEGKTGTSSVTVSASVVPVATVAVSPATLSLTVGGAGQSLTATPKDASGNALSGRVVTWSSSAASVASVSSAGFVTPVAAGTATITATSEGKTGTSAVTVASAVAATNLTVPGQSVSFLGSPNFSTTLAVQANSQYLVAVVNTDNSLSIREDFTLSGTLAASSAARQVPVAPRERLAAPVRLSPAAGPTYDVDPQTIAAFARARGLAQNHIGMLEANRQVWAQFGNPRAVRAKLQAQVTGRQASAVAPVSQAIGTVNKIYVRKSLSGTCTTVDSIYARTVAVGQHVIVLADTNRGTWPQSVRPDSSYYQAFATEYDQVTWPHLLGNIGNPLAYDASLSGIGKVTVTITPELNNFGGLSGGGSVVAFVSLCDFFPFASTGPNADFSNQTEMFYSWAPLTSSGFTVAQWGEGLRATAAHETKHIVSFSDRILNNSPVLEEIWLEEGLAQESSEIWERNFSQATWKGNANFLQTAACEIPLGPNAPCDQAGTKPIALLLSHLPFFFEYLQGESTNSEGLGQDTPANYGAGWTIARWATDQYASTESAFIQSLINEPQLSGLANLSQHTAQPVATLLAYWNVATAIFQVPTYTAADVRTTFPSFNFADIFNVGQTRLTCSGTPCGLFTSSGQPVFPLQPISLTAGNIFQQKFGIPGTSASFFLLSSATAGTQSLQLLSGTGAALAAGSGFRVVILRVQ